MKLISYKKIFWVGLISWNLANHSFSTDLQIVHIFEETAENTEI